MTVTNIKADRFVPRYGKRFGETTVEQILRRVSECLGYDPHTRKMVYEAMNAGAFLPGGRVLANIHPDPKRMGVVTNCFVLPLEDSMESVFRTMQNAMRLQSHGGGGVGTAFSRLREQDASIAGNKGRSCGPVPFIDLFDHFSQVINYSFDRKTANIAVLSQKHPNVLDFIWRKAKAKLAGTKAWQSYNVSVDVSEMNEDDPTLLEMAKAAWECGDPGMVNLGVFNKRNVLQSIEEIIGVNPCGEQPLPAFGSCNIGAINLYYHWMGGSFDSYTFRDTVNAAVIALNQVIEMAQYPVEGISEQAKWTRRIGIGYMGVHDALIHCETPYDSDDGIRFIRDSYGSLWDSCQKASEDLVKVYGVSPALDKLINTRNAQIVPRANSHLLSQAPTGSIAMAVDVSSGIEPWFAWEYNNRMATGEVVKVEHPTYRRYKDKPLPPFLKTASEIDPAWHLKAMMAAYEHVDSGVSKTINLPNSTTVEEIHEIYKWAIREQLPALTVYRDGSHPDQPLTVTKDKKETRKRKSGPVSGMMDTVETPDGKVYLKFFPKEGEDTKTKQVFITLGKSGSVGNSMATAIGRVTSIALQNGVPMKKLAQTLIGIGSDGASFGEVFGRRTVVRSVPDALGQALHRLDKLESGEEDSTEVAVVEERRTGPNCPHCHSSMMRSEGCEICPTCGFSKCGG